MLLATLCRIALQCVARHRPGDVGPALSPPITVGGCPDPQPRSKTVSQTAFARRRPVPSVPAAARGAAVSIRRKQVMRIGLRRAATVVVLTGLLAVGAACG